MPCLGIDASRSVIKEKTGVEWYAYSLLEAMAKKTPGDWQVVLYSPSPPQEKILIENHWLWQKIFWPWSFLWSQGGLSCHFLFFKPDVFFVPAHVLPLIHPQKSLVTLHDVGFCAYPQFYSFFERLYQDFSTRFALEEAQQIIVPSFFTKTEILKFYGERYEDKISVIPHGIDFQFWNSRCLNDQIALVRKKYFLNKPYFLFIGRLEKKKNVSFLIDCFKDPFLNDYDLVLIGKQDKKFHLGPLASQNIKILGWVPREELKCLLQHALCLIAPSLYEGFGLTLLEGLAAGVPIIASEIPAHKEVAWHYPLYFNPFKKDSLLETIKKFLKSSYPQELIRDGIEHAFSFSWERAAILTWQVIEKMIE